MRPTLATVRLADIAHNYRVAVSHAPGSQSIAVIKADAYGHGMVEVARHLQSMVPVFAVAFIDEAVRLRDAGISNPILILQGASRASDLIEAVYKNFWLLLHQQQQVDWLLSARLPGPVRVWLKLETGMHRLGFEPELLDPLCTALSSSSNVQQDLVVCTHLACADDLADPMTRQQVSVIRSCAGKHNLALSIANSAGILYWPESHADWNRPGYMLYGNNPAGSFDNMPSELRPAMSMNSEVIAIREVSPGEG